ncbi:MAG: GHKL domain-containing protein [Lachnospiraceae bacterium]|nr:GHKL domain-containing protein [Lachnospiraceae bacterium]MBR5047820.1 GHKL domain-containing protein [Eubacterium sp.]
MKLRYKIIFAVWIVLFLTLPSMPFESEVDDMADRYQYLCLDMSILFPLLGVVAPIIFVMGTSARALKEKNEAQERYLSAELEYIEQYKSAQTQTRAFRHDVVNNLSLATMLMEEGKTEEANEHLKEMLGKVQELSQRFVTGDEMLDCIVSMKAEKMKEKGIFFTTDGVAEGGLKMKPMDLCSIFANALDNAMEAAADTQKPVVHMKIKRTDTFFVIEIENSALHKADVEKLISGEGYTTKKDKESHGFGLQNIKKTVEENGGMLRARSEEESFALSVMIPRKTENTV